MVTIIVINDHNKMTYNDKGCDYMMREIDYNDMKMMISLCDG